MLRIRLPCWGSAGRSGRWLLGRGAAPGGHRLTPHPATALLLWGRGTLIAPGETAACSTQGCPCSWGGALNASWVLLDIPILEWAGLSPPGLGQGCRVSLRSHQLPAVRSPLQPEQVTEVLMGARV